MIQNALPRLGSWQENVLLWQDWRVERFEEWLSERGWETFQSDMSEVLKIVFILFSFLSFQPFALFHECIVVEQFSDNSST